MKNYITILFFHLPILIFSQDFGIVEVNYKNNSLTDSFGNTPDWIELINPETHTENLSGWFLSDDDENLQKWAFPPISVPANERMIVFASGKDLINGNEIHTNFKLKKGGEKLYLSEGNILVQTVESFCLPEGHSLVIDPFTNHYFWDSIPSPGTSPGISYFPIPEDHLNWTHEAGTVPANDQLNITSDLGLNVHFTQNNRLVQYIDPVFEHWNFSERKSPSLAFENTSDQWVYPEKVTTIITIAAQSFFATCPVSSQEIRSFIPDNIENHLFPTVSLHIKPSDFFGDLGIYIKGSYENYFQKGENWERTAYFEHFSNGILHSSSFVDLRINGHGSRANPQKSLRTYFKNKYNLPYTSNNYFAELPSDLPIKRMILRSPGSDFTNSLIRDPFFTLLVKNSGIDYLSDSPCLLYLNGEYWGMHFIKERADKYHFSNAYNIDPDHIHILENNSEVSEGTGELWFEVRNYMLQYDLAEQEHYEWVSNRVDIDNFCSFIVYNDLAANWDLIPNNTKIWYADSIQTKIRFIAYDGDATFYKTSFDLIDYILSFEDNTLILPVLFRNLWKNDTFKNSLYSSYSRILGKEFKAGAFFEETDNLITTIAPLIPDHQLRWHTPVNINAWEKQIKDIQSFIILRSNSILKTIEKKIGHSLPVYPNPVSSAFSIDIPIGTAFKVYDLYGKPLIEGLYSGSINIESLSNGVYFIKYEIGALIQNTQFQVLK